jgi:hypothetical protein
MDLYIARMVDEKNLLEDKTRKAEFFLKNSSGKLDEAQQEMLSRQIEAMKAYHEILTARIEYDVHKARAKI